MRNIGIAALVAAFVGFAGPVWADSTFKVRAVGSYLVQHDIAIVMFDWFGPELFEGRDSGDAARNAANKQVAKFIAYFREIGLETQNFRAERGAPMEDKQNQITGHRAYVYGKVKLPYTDPKKDRVVADLKDKFGVKFNDPDGEVTQAARTSETAIDGVWRNLFANGRAEARAMARAAGCALEGDVDADATNYKDGHWVDSEDPAASTREEKKNTGVMISRAATLIFHASGCKPRS